MTTITILLAIIASALIFGGRQTLNVITWLLVSFLILGAVIGVLAGVFWLVALIVFGVYQYSAEIGGLLMLGLFGAVFYAVVFIASKINWFGAKNAKHGDK